MAVQRERPGRQRTLTAFGETKSLKRWTEDGRCSVPVNVMIERLKAGYSPEDAVSAPHRPTNKRYEAFGESKLLKEWFRDKRCVVSFQALFKRVKAGMPLEEALTKPMFRQLVDFSAFGESKRLKEWVTDPRCVVSPNAVYMRLRNGMSLEAALTTPAAPPPTSIPNPNIKRYAAFGELKTCEEWSRDDRCCVCDATLRKRLNSGMAPETALTLSVKEHRLSLPPKPRSSPLGLQGGFGEAKTFEEWHRDPRCVVSSPTIMKRVAAGMSIEQAITEPIARPHQMLIAFGEEKSIDAWAKDPRAAVGPDSIRKRLNKGFPPELAITEPPANPGIRRFWDLKRRGLLDESGRLQLGSITLESGEIIELG